MMKFDYDSHRISAQKTQNNNHSLSKINYRYTKISWMISKAYGYYMFEDKFVYIEPY